jgi:hypothetical protein
VKKVLIAENIESLLTQGNDFLHRPDIAVFIAATSDDMLRTHIEEKVNLIITTFGLPGLSCEALFATIRQSKELAAAFTFIVCEDTPGHRERSSWCGANAVMTMPVNPVLFARKVQELLDVAPRRPYRVILNVVVEGASKNRTFLCSSENISARGLLIKTGENLGCGDRISCSFYLPGDAKVSVHGKIVRAVREEGSNINRYGVMFTDMSPDTRATVEAFINKEVRRNVESAPGPHDTLVA